MYNNFYLKNENNPTEQIISSVLKPGRHFYYANKCWAIWD